MRILKSIQKFEYEFDIKAERFLWKHPFLGFLSIICWNAGFCVGLRMHLYCPDYIPDGMAFRMALVFM